MYEVETLTGARHVGLEGAPPPTLLPVPPRRAQWPWILLGALLLVGFAGGGAWWWTHRVPTTKAIAGQSSSGALTTAAPASDALPALPPPDALKPVTPEDAIKLNAERPLVTRPDTPARKFALSGDAVSKLRAIDCLTQAVYYEAASEGPDGGRAVAQVVLNRMRHPGYPNSVCGVVYQGSNKPTGCQFTFTCDGSLSRVPAGYLWARSRLIATEALAGRVFAPVGHATHYHANYVVPYWADSLDKVAVIGRHIFYRLRGGNGSGDAFSQGYAGAEPMPPPPATEVIDQGLDALAPPVEIDPNLPPAAKVEEDQVKQLAPPPKPASERSSLAADLSRGQLILGEPGPGEGGTNPKKKAVAAPSDCQGGGGASRIKAVGAVDLKATGGTSGC